MSDFAIGIFTGIVAVLSISVASIVMLYLVWSKAERKLDIAYYDSWRHRNE